MFCKAEFDSGASGAVINTDWMKKCDARFEFAFGNISAPARPTTPIGENILETAA